MIFSQPRPDARSRIGPVTDRAVKRLLPLLLCAVLYGCSEKAATETATLQLKWVYNAGFSGDLIASQRRLWPGLSVTVREGGAGINPISSVVAGEADFGVAAGDQLLLARAAGAPVVAIALTYQRNPLVWITRTRDSIESAGDLHGRVVGLTYIDDEPLFRAWVAHSAAVVDSIQIQRVQFDLTPFLTGRVAAYPVFSNTQAIEIAESLGRDSVRLIGPEDAGLISYSNLYFTTEKTLQEKPEMVRAFLSGVMSGWLLAADSPSVAAQIVARYDRTTPYAVTLASVRATNALVWPPSGTQFGVMSSEGWASTERILRDAGELTHPVAIDSIFTNAFLPAPARRRRPAGPE